MSGPTKPFFVGYFPVPDGFRRWLLKVRAVFVLGLATVGLIMGIAQDDPDPGAFRFDHGR